MHSNFKLLILDLDGTTVEASGDALPSRRVIDAVQKAQANVHVALVTGRWLEIAQPIAEALGLEGPSVLSGGARIFDFTTGEDISREELSPELLKQLAEIVLPFGYATTSVGVDHQVELSDPGEIKKPAVMLHIAGVRTRDAELMLIQLQGVRGAVAHMANSWTKGDFVDVHITHDEASKGHGAQRLTQLLGLRPDEVIAIGDNHNDLPLFEVAGFKVAMGDGEEALKAVADHIAPSLAEDGVADTIERFILAEPKKPV